MSSGLPGSESTRDGLRDLIEGRLSSESSRSKFVRPVTPPIIEKWLEAEVRDALGRGHYEHSSEPGRGYPQRGARGAAEGRGGLRSIWPVAKAVYSSALARIPQIDRDFTDLGRRF
jgi:hypothetical protein